MQVEDPPHDETRDMGDENSSPADDGANAASEIDPMVASAVSKIADALNELKRHLDNRDGVSVLARGSLDVSVGAQDYRLAIVQSEEGEEYPLTVVATRQIHHTTGVTNTSAFASTRRDSDHELESDIVSRKRRRLDEHDTNDTNGQKRQRVEGNRYGQEEDDEEEDEDNELFLSKRDLQGIVDKLREDIQDDTSECVNHVQKLLRRFKAEWHQHAQSSNHPTRSPPTNPVAAAFPTTRDEGDKDASIADTIKRESKLLASQIKWVEECRRVAHEIHERREENWRTTSAGFHDRGRQDREIFQHKILYEHGLNTQKLNQILNEVRAIGLYTQTMKWETPASASYSGQPHPTPRAPSSFPTRHSTVPASPAPTRPATSQPAQSSQAPQASRGP